MATNTNTGSTTNTTNTVSNSPGAAIASGDHSTAATTTQTIHPQMASVDLAALARELGALREKLRSEAAEEAHFDGLAKLAAAEKAAATGDRAGAFEKLKGVGAWVWSVAEKVGIGVAVLAAKAAIDS